MSVLTVKIEDGTTVVKVDGQPVSSIRNVSLKCGIGKGVLALEASPFGADVISEEAELVVTIPDSLGNALKEQ